MAFSNVWYVHVVTYIWRKKFNMYFFLSVWMWQLFDIFTHWTYDLRVILNVMYDCNEKNQQHCCCFWMILMWREVTSKTTNRHNPVFFVLSGFEQNWSTSILSLMISFLLIPQRTDFNVLKYIIWILNKQIKRFNA